MWVFFFLLQQFLMSNKLETAMWLSRLFTVYCSVMFILPILGWVHSVTLFYPVWPTATRCFHPLILSPRLNRCQNIFPACVFQTLCSSKLLSESLVSERPHQCPSPSSKAATLSWPRLFRRTAAITCCTHSSWSTLTPSQVSFQLQT